MPRKPLDIPEAVADQLMLHLSKLLANQLEEHRDVVLRALIQCAEGMLAARRELRRAKERRAMD